VNKPVIVLVGPTGVGKTELSIQIAKWLSVEIISADSRQIFKKLDIGTAKPDKSLRKKIPHHYIDRLEPDQDYSAGQFGNDARETVREIFGRNHVPLVVGGSGLYIRALTEGFFSGEEKDPENRKRLQKRLKTEGSDSLYNELDKIDPVTARSIHPQNGKRIVRALEVYYNTGKPLSVLWQKKSQPPEFSFIKFGLLMDRKQLYHRINERVEQMFSDGLLEEVKNILSAGYPPQLNSLNTVGYKEVIDFLEGKTDYQTCIELIQRNTRRYAKRQMTWFNAEKDIRWLPVAGDSRVTELAETIIGEYRRLEKNQPAATKL
jgi:tRNA dimethylallyltransferase